MRLCDDSRRLVLEEQAMRRHWGAAPRLRDDGRRMWWEMVITEFGNELPIRIVYPSGYPSCPPEIEAVEHLPSGTPHVLPGRHLCWRSHGSDRRAEDIWNPALDTAALTVGVAKRWFLAFLTWRDSGKWPEG